MVAGWHTLVHTFEFVCLVHVIGGLIKKAGARLVVLLMSPNVLLVAPKVITSAVS